MGWYDDALGRRHGFVATAVPEPGALTLAGIGALTLLLGSAGGRLSQNHPHQIFRHLLGTSARTVVLLYRAAIETQAVLFLVLMKTIGIGELETFGTPQFSVHPRILLFSGSRRFQVVVSISAQYGHQKR